MGEERIRTLLHSHRRRFIRKMTEALDRGWEGWTKQVVEFHTFCADHENRKKEGKGFFKLNEDKITAVREDLVTDYKALVNPHSE